jgi:nitrate/nitrite transporter NarK
MNSVFGSSLMAAGAYTAFTAFGGMLGCICGGLATDRMVRLWGPVWGRRLPGLIACGGAGGLYLLVPLMGSLPIDPERAKILTTCLFFGIYFSNDFLLGSLWSTVQDVGGRNSGAMFGFVNMSGNLGAAIFPPIIGALVDARNWPAVFVISACAFAVAWGLWFFVNPRIKLPARGGV